MQRYFVVIFAPDAASLRTLQKFELDVFAQTAKRSGGDSAYPYSIDGLLSLAEVETVVKAGYQVQIQEPEEKRARGAGAVTDFPQWLTGMTRTLKRERANKK